jgi:hypothetical protein
LATSKRILYTAFEGGVHLCQPTDDIFRIMQTGGYWNDRPRGFFDEQIARQMSDGIAERHARRFALAVQFGGCSEAEAWEIIRDRDCAHRGTLHELIDVAELPPDRWFRGAWHRSANGGPVVINLRKARRIQLERIKTVVARHNHKRTMLGRSPFKAPWLTYGAAIRHARDDEELRRVWPEELARRTTT